MLGRAAYQNPDLLAAVDAEVYGDPAGVRDANEAVASFREYVAEGLARGVPLAVMVRPMLGLFAGRPGARAWRRILTVESVPRGAGIEVIDRARSALRPAHAAGEASVGVAA